MRVQGVGSRAYARQRTDLGVRILVRSFRVALGVRVGSFAPPSNCSSKSCYYEAIRTPVISSGNSWYYKGE